MRATIFRIVQMKHLKFDNLSVLANESNRRKKDAKERWTNANFIVINAHSRTTTSIAEWMAANARQWNGIKNSTSSRHPFGDFLV